MKMLNLVKLVIKTFLCGCFLLLLLSSLVIIIITWSTYLGIYLKKIFNWHDQWLLWLIYLCLILPLLDHVDLSLFMDSFLASLLLQQGLPSNLKLQWSLSSFDITLLTTISLSLTLYPAQYIWIINLFRWVLVSSHGSDLEVFLALLIPSQVRILSFEDIES